MDSAISPGLRPAIRENVHTLFLEESAAHDFSHGGHLLLLQFLKFLGGDAGVEVVQQLTGERKQRGAWINNQRDDYTGEATGVDWKWAAWIFPRIIWGQMIACVLKICCSDSSCGTVEQRLALLPKQQCSWFESWFLLYGLCTFSLCLRGFSQGTQSFLPQ